jgi:hypothetical protein
MPSIHQLIPDIYKLLGGKNDGWFTDDLSGDLARELGLVLKTNMGNRSPKRALRLSQMGIQCPHALWLSVHSPELAEPTQPWAIIKFSYGHIIESLILTLAKAAGHDVQGEQDEVTLDGVTGHRDAVIDGCIVDVKSAASRSFEKFKNRLLEQDDSFGYLDQLDGYVVGSYDDPLVSNKTHGYILAVEKQLGHLCLYEHRIREQSIRDRISYYRKVVASDVPPACSCGTVADGESGNVKLDMRASYNPFKWECFPHLRAFLYSGGPRYLTKVVKQPKNKDGPIREVDKHGKQVYH